MMHGYFGDNGFGYGGSIWGGIIMILIWIIVAGLIAYAVYRAVKKSGKGVSGNQLEDPLQILKTRYAKGEISKDEYLAMKSDLQ